MMSKVRQLVAFLFNPDTALHWTVFVIGFLMYANTLPNGYTFGDSAIATEHNELVAEGISGIPEIFIEQGYGWFDFTPLAKATFALEYQIAGNYYLLSNYIQIILFGSVCIVLLVLLSRLFPKSAITTRFIAIALFAVHPANTQVVNSMPGRADLMSLLFFGLGVIYFWNWYEHKSVRHLLAGSVFSLLALLSDFEIATWFVLPIFILMAVRGTTLKKVLPILGASLVAIILYAVYRSFNIAEVETLAVYNPMIDFSDRGERLTMAFCSIAMYLKLLVIPDQLVSAYGSGHFSIVGWHDPMVYLAIIGTSLLGFIVVFFHKRLPLLSIGGLMVLLDVIPFTNIVSLQPTYFDEKVLFGATFGLSLMLASGIGYVFKIDPEESFKSTYMKKPAMASLVLILVCLASFQTYSRNYDWVNNYKLTTNDVEHSDNAVMNYQCGRFLRQEYLIYPVRDINAHVDSAAFYLERSITQSNKWPEPIIELGRLRLYESAQPEIALSLFQQAAELKGSDIEFILDVGRCLADLGRTGEAIEVFGELLEHDSENIDAIDAIVNLYLIANYTDEAEFVNQRFFQFHPDAYQPFEYQGMIVLARGDTAQALNYFLESLKRNDQNLALQYFYDQLNPNSVANNGR